MPPTQKRALRMLALVVVEFAVTLVARAGKAVSDGTPSLWGRRLGTKAACTLENSLSRWPRTHSPGLTALGSLAVPDQKATGPASMPVCQDLSKTAQPPRVLGSKGLPRPAPSCLPSQWQGKHKNTVSKCSLPAIFLPFLRNSGLDAEAPLVDPGPPKANLLLSIQSVSDHHQKSRAGAGQPHTLASGVRAGFRAS